MPDVHVWNSCDFVWLALVIILCAYLRPNFAFFPVVSFCSSRTTYDLGRIDPCRAFEMAIPVKVTSGSSRQPMMGGAGVCSGELCSNLCQ